MDNEQKINQIRPTVDQNGIATWNYLTNGAASGNYNNTTNQFPPQSQASLYNPVARQSPLPITYVTGQGLSSESLEQVRAVVREELQREQSHDRSGTVHICIDGQWYQGDLYPTEEEANG